MKMDRAFFEKEVESALDVLLSGGTILYPTDTVWGIGCDATNADAVAKVFRIKQRDDKKSLIILVADERHIFQYVAGPDPEVFDFLAAQTRPTTVIFDQAINLPENLVAEDGTIAIRVVKDDFCRHLVKRLRRPIVSTSANISGQPSPGRFSELSAEIKSRVDHIAKWRQDDEAATLPSRIVKWGANGSHTIIRS